LKERREFRQVSIQLVVDVLGGGRFGGGEGLGTRQTSKIDLIIPRKELRTCPCRSCEPRGGHKGINLQRQERTMTGIIMGHPELEFAGGYGAEEDKIILTRAIKL